MTIKWYQPRILIHLYVKIWIKSNTFSWLVRLTSNRQAKLRVTLRNLLARFSAKRSIDRKKLTTHQWPHTRNKKITCWHHGKMMRSFPRSAFEDPTAFRVRHVLLLVSILTSNAPGQWSLVRFEWRSPVYFFFFIIIKTYIQTYNYNMYNVNASALWMHYIMRLCKIDLRNNNDKTVQPIEYKLTIPNTFHIERVNHCGLEWKFWNVWLVYKFHTFN